MKKRFYMSDNKTNTQKVVNGLSAQTIVTLSIGIVEIIYFSIMSRILSREDFGFFAVISAVTVIFSSISEAGIGAALIQKKEVNNDYKNTAFTLSLIIGAFVAAIMSISSGLIANLIMGDKELKEPLMWMSLTILFYGINSINFSWMRRNLKFLKAGMISLTSFLISDIFSIYLALKGFGYYAILSRAVSSSILSFLISSFFVGTFFKLVIKRNYVSSIVNYGGWLTASVIVRNIAQQTDRLLMSRLLTVSELGSYNRPKGFISHIADQLNGVFDTALFPVLSSIQDNKSSLRNAFNSSQYYMNMFAMIAALGFICNSSLLIRIFLGEQWLDLQVLFCVLSISVLFNINGRLADCYFRSLALVKQQFYFRIFQLVINVIAIFIGYRWGILGVAVSFILASFINILIKTKYISDKVEIRVNKTFKNIFDGWKFSVFFFPLITASCFCSGSLLYEILIAFLFLLLSVSLFCFFPKAIGRKYSEEAYLIVKKKTHYLINIIAPN